MNINELANKFYIKNLVNGWDIAKKAAKNLIDNYDIEEIKRITNFDEIGIVEYVANDEYRICSECHKLMADGYVVDNGAAYYCDDECLHKHFTDEEWEDLYEEAGDNYWTTFY